MDFNNLNRVVELCDECDVNFTLEFEQNCCTWYFIIINIDEDIFVGKSKPLNEAIAEVIKFLEEKDQWMRY